MPDAWKKNDAVDGPPGESDEFYSFEIEGLDSYIAIGPGNKKKVWHYALIRNSGEIVFQKDTFWKFDDGHLNKAKFDALRETFERISETRRMIRIAMDDLLDHPREIELPRKPKVGRRKKT
jgi:hypothetical protein